ncbi:LLM class flavin-dependent oxidoreductase [Streptomyces sp. NRRL F-5630]|uniref:LLM class flavin-dependent oxidoreductase n=1 Tax=Streptomyces sp. NRRL F-5630 TaxID=1463864 RepID=UPI003D761C5E
MTMRYSLVLPIVAVRPEQAVPFANLVRWTRAERLWQGQSQVVDNHQLAAWLAGIGIRVPTGFGVDLTPLRTPYHAASEARSTALVTGCPVLAAYGPGWPDYQRAVLGEPYRSPLAATRDYVSAVRALLRGELAENEGGAHPMRAGLLTVPAPEVRVGIGALRPRMAELAGQVADAAVTWLSPPEHLRDVLVPRVTEASAAAGRDPVPTTAIVPMALAEDGREHDDTALATFGAHLRAPHYQAALREAGLDLSGEPADAAKLTEAGGFLWGTPSDIRDGLRRYEEAGVDEVVLNVTGVAATKGARAAASDLERVLDIL